MRLLRLTPADPRFHFMRWHGLAFAVSAFVAFGSVAAVWLLGLNLGLDFTGGLLVEARSAASIDLERLRTALTGLGLGEVAIQTFGGGHDVLIRLGLDSDEGIAADRASAAIGAVLGPAFEIRRTEMVGPQVSDELLRNGATAAALAVGLIGVYLWVRFEWQFGIAAVLATLHDVVGTVGLFSVLGLEFNMTVVAALLTVAGYSVNDTVVVFDRVRENLRQHKAMPMAALIDLSVNRTLSRTAMTTATTLLAALSLLFFGGAVLQNFSIALVWGVAIGTFSSVFVASALLLYMPTLRTEEEVAPQA